jgi:hypothetical protein
MQNSGLKKNVIAKEIKVFLAISFPLYSILKQLYNYRTAQLAQKMEKFNSLWTCGAILGEIEAL